MLPPPSTSFHERHAHLLQELNKLLPEADAQADPDLDQPPQYEELDEQDGGEQEKQYSIKISPLARPYISFGPDIRQHPCAMSTRTQQMCVPAFMIAEHENAN